MDYKFTFEDGSEALAHYGVLGMRWGVRHDKGFRGAKASAKAAYKNAMQGAASRGEKAKAKEQYRNSINEAKVKAANRLYSTNSTEANRRIQTRSTAKTIGMSALLGSYGTMHYDRAVSEHASKGKAIARALGAAYLNNYTMGGAGLHNYLVDRRGRSSGKTSNSSNRRYMSSN